jgi:hypothetical protein
VPSRKHNQDVVVVQECLVVRRILHDVAPEYFSATGFFDKDWDLRRDRAVVLITAG